MESKGRVKKMAISLRDRPKLEGKDLERFLKHAQENEKSMKEYAAKKIQEFNKISSQEDK